MCGVFKDNNILEGFRQNTELLCNESYEASKFDESFLKLCIEDNNLIIKVASEFGYKIPKITLQHLKDILLKKLKLNKACDVFHLTVEHLRYSGDQTLSFICELLNKMINDLSCLSSPQLNTAVATVIYKGKDKPLTHHKSYRLVRVTPMLSRLINEFLRPQMSFIIKQRQNPSQYGFTEKMNYLMGALQRHECEKW